jgi:UDP-N-acetylglucosamine--N-acetylmuramyl-(pentapeptide) pyrophosphoryl-undecaprenol N-acetylglucosamine transferase
MRIVLTGGGTGGHIFPLIAVARELRKRVPAVELFFIGPEGFGTDRLSAEGVTIRPIIAGKIPRYLTPRIFIELLKIPIGFLQAFWELYWHMPDVVFGKGGYGMLPVAIIAWLFRIPVIIHESDAVAGLATRIVTRFAKETLLSFPQTSKLRRSVVRIVGNPVRTTLLHGDPLRAQKRFGLTLKPIVLVLGGSQGSELLNSLMTAIAPDLTSEAEVIHQVGPDRMEEFQRELEVAFGERNDGLAFYHIVPFLDEEALADAYAVTTVAVSRAGAGAIFELALVGIPTIFLPLLHAAGNHQFANAQLLTEAGAARMIGTPTPEPHLILSELRALLRNEKLREDMRKRFRAFAKPYAAAHIAEIILTYAVPR